MLEASAMTPKMVAARDAALSGADREVSLLAVDQYVRFVSWTVALAEGEEEQLLARLVRGRAQAGTSLSADAWMARDRLVEGYQPLVLDIARRWEGRFRTGDLMDRVQDGNVGLLKALAAYDEGQEYPFRALAVHCICQALAVSCWGDGLVTVPRRARKDFKALKQAELAWFQQYGREPSAGELAQVMGVPLERVFDLLVLARCRSISSLEEITQRYEYPEEYFAFASPFRSVIESAPAWKSATIQQALERVLAPRQREVITYRYGFGELYADRGMLLEELAAFLGIAPTDIHTIEEGAKLRLAGVLAPVLRGQEAALPARVLPCEVCGKPVEQPGLRKRRYCSRQCNHRAYYRAQKAVGQTEGAGPCVVTCVVCGKEVIRQKHMRQRLYCSKTCKNRAFRMNRRQALRAEVAI